MPKQHIYDHLLGLICSVFEAYSVVLFLPEEQGAYKLTSYFSIGDNILPQCRLEPGQGLVGWILRNREPLLVTDFDREGDCLGYYSQKKEKQIKAFMGCPLDGGAGALCLDSKRSHSFSTKDQKILHQFAQLIQQLQNDVSQSRDSEQEKHYYLCLQTMRLLRRKYHRWSSYLTSFLRTLSQYSGFSYCLFASRSETGTGYYLEGANNREILPDSGAPQGFDINEGLVGWVFRNHTMVSSTERKDSSIPKRLLSRNAKLPEFRSVICLPIVIHNRTRGVLVLADTSVESIPHGLEEFLQLVAEQLSLFLENLYLRNKLKNTGTQL